MKTLIVIPARYASTRYLGKPLVTLTGPDGPKTLIQRTWEAAQHLSKLANDLLLLAESGEASAPHVREAVDLVSVRLGRRLKFLVGKPGLDGHSNGAEQIAARARDCGMDIRYEGIRLTPTEIVAAAADEQAHVVGLSILSGSHMPLIAEVLDRMRTVGLGNVPLVVGGIIPPADAEALIKTGVARVYTPKDFDLTQIMRDIVAVVDGAWKEAA